jgi:transcriptional regulator with XRE-family HTH domain
MNFGELLKTVRITNRLTLRQCSAQLGVDASNWSKIERGVNSAPKDITVLKHWASFFHLDAKSRQAFFDAAFLSRHELPPDIATDERLLQALPAFFRAVRSNEMDQTKTDHFVQDIKAIHTRDKLKQKRIRAS